MSKKILSTPMYIKDKTSDKMLPVSMIASGATESLSEIKNYADSKVNEAKNKIEEKANEALNSIPESYTEITGEVSRLSESIADMSNIVVNGLEKVCNLYFNRYGLNYNAGSVNDSNNRIHSTITIGHVGDILYVDADYEFFVNYYNKSGFVESSYNGVWQTGFYKIKYDGLFVACLRKKDDSNFTKAECNNANEKVVLFSNSYESVDGIVFGVGHIETADEDSWYRVYGNNYYFLSISTNITGASIDSTRYNSCSIVKVPKGTKISTKTGYRIFVFVYDDEGKCTSTKTWSSSYSATKDENIRILLDTNGDKRYYTEWDALSEIVTVEYPNDEQDTNSLPKYWEDYLDRKDTELKNADISLGFDGVSFAFVTDVHWSNNYKMSPIVISEILKRTSINDVIFGGDIIVGYRPTKEEAISHISDYSSKMKSLNCINLHGNHDNNSNDNVDTTTRLTNSDFYSIACRQTEHTVQWENGKLYGYMDNQVQKIRMVFLDTGAPDWWNIGEHDTEQLAWMQDKISELSEDWGVIVFCHQFFNPSNKDASTLTLDGNGTAIMNALDNIYDSVNAKIIAVITGHCHRNYSIVSAKGYPIIATTTDSALEQASRFDPDCPTRTKGTTTEQAFDLYYVNTTNKTIDIIRIGAGDTVLNRHFDYA